MKKMLNVRPFQETLNAGMCGPASLKLVLNYYGLDKSEQELAELTKNDKDLGSTAENITEAARKLGFMAEIKNECDFADIEDWLNKDVPMIVDWFTRGRDDYPEEIAASDGHYSVVCGLDDDYIFLQDPEIGGIRKMKRDVFKKVWFDFMGEYIRPNELITRQIIAIYR